MANLQATIEQAIKNYPLIFRCRTDVLEHMFCSTGNGYEWQDGELVAVDPRTPKKPKSTQAALKDHLASMEVIWQRFEQLNPGALAEKKFREENDPETFLAKKLSEQRFVFIHENAGMLAQIGWMNSMFGPKAKPNIFNQASLEAFVSPRTIGRLNPEYSPLFNLPDDIKPSWLEGAREMIYTIFASTQIVGQTDMNRKQKIQSIAENIAKAEECLEEINKRFGEHEPSSYEKWLEAVIQADPDKQCAHINSQDFIDISVAAKALVQSDAETSQLKI